MSIPVSTEEPLAVIVEDVPELRALYSSALRQAGFRVTVFDDGDRVVEAALRLRPAVICLDIVMPSVCGLDVLDQLRSTPATADIPVIVASARTSPQDRANAELAGATQYLTKPVHPVELGERARALIARVAA